MKQKSFLRNLTISFASVILIASCSRDVVAPHQLSQAQSSSKVLNLVADKWQLQSAGSVYTNSFNGIMQNRAGTPLVYIVSGDNETLISSGIISFANGEVWSANTGTDLIIFYRDFYQEGLPFGSLNIRVVFE